MTALYTIVLDKIDDELLKQQTKALTEIMAYLSTGEESPDAEDWPEAIEGLLNLLAAIGHEIDKARGE